VTSSARSSMRKTIQPMNPETLPELITVIPEPAPDTDPGFAGVTTHWELRRLFSDKP